jgi:hypothetical protein
VTYLAMATVRTEIGTCYGQIGMFRVSRMEYRPPGSVTVERKEDSQQTACQLYGGFGESYGFGQDGWHARALRLTIQLAQAVFQRPRNYQRYPCRARGH